MKLWGEGRKEAGQKEDEKKRRGGWNAWWEWEYSTDQTMASWFMLNRLDFIPKMTGCMEGF